MHDLHFMTHALGLAHKALGTTAPNPAVGCVIVKHNQIVGQGHTQKHGRPHAETVALAQAGSLAHDATAYITLEPCCHQGQTPPCTDALIQAGISKVVIATTDPYAKVNGKGIETLKKAGVEIIYGICEEEAYRLNIGFFTVQYKSRPFITLKLATSLDGRIATHNGKSKWITNEQSRHYAHLLRAQHDALLVGINTVLTDNPLLTCRIEGMEHKSPIRVVLDSQLRTPEDSQVIQTSHDVPCWIYSQKQGTLGAAEIMHRPEEELNPHAIVKDLAAKGITRLLVEGGSKIATSFVKENLVDELIWIKAPILIGSDGIPAIGQLNLHSVGSCPHFTRVSSEQFGSDTVEVYRNDLSLPHTIFSEN